MRRIALLVGALSASQPALGEESHPGKAEARLHFEEGLAHAQHGDFDAALKAFEAAYARRPHYSVLYNIAQAQAALGRSLEAVASFERYLSEGGAYISEARREAVRAAIAATQKTIGHLKISVAAPDRTRIWLNGVELSASQLGESIPLSAGKHRLLHSTGSGYPVAAEITVSGAETTDFRIEAPDEVRHDSAELQVTCLVPGFIVLVDEVAAASTPVPGLLPLPSGTHRINFVRVGYQADERTVTIRPGETARVDCNARVEAQLARALAARLTIHTTPQDAHVLLDGRTFTGGTLPLGPHDLRVERDGYLPYRKTISLAGSKPHYHQVVLQPTRAKRIREQRAARHRKTVAYFLGGTGLALLASSGGVLLWNQKRYEDWRHARSPDTNRIASIQRVDDVALGLAILGTGLALGSTWAFLTNEPPDD